MITTNIPRLDELLGGGIPAGKSLLYLIEPGVIGDVFGMQTFASNLEQGMKGIYLTTTAPPNTVKKEFLEYGWDVERFENLIFIDGYSNLVGLRPESEYHVEDPENIECYKRVLEKACDDLGDGSIITFGSLSSVMDLCGERKTLEFIEYLTKRIMLKDDYGVFNFTRWPYESFVFDKLLTTFDAVVSVGGIAQRVIIGQYYVVTNVKWCEIREKSILFKVLRPGGVKAYIPKILVTGPYNAGKSTFIHTISKKAVSVDRLGTTVALDHGYVDHKGYTADIFGTPGQERFDPILRRIAGETIGVFLVIDSSKPETFKRAKHMIEITKTHGLPLVIVANKQDLADALDVEEIRKIMKISEEVPLVPCVATKSDKVINAFEILIDLIFEGEWGVYSKGRSRSDSQGT